MIDIVESNTKFTPVDRWAKLPMGITFRGDATSVATDSKDNVYVFNRGNEPIAVFDCAILHPSLRQIQESKSLLRIEGSPL